MYPRTPEIDGVVPYIVISVPTAISITQIEISGIRGYSELTNIVTHRMQEERITISREHNSWDYMYNCFETIF